MPSVKNVPGVGDAAQLVEGFFLACSKLWALSSAPHKPGVVVAHAYNPSTERTKVGHLKCRVILGHTVSLK